MIDRLVETGKITDPEVERAFRRVKRHYFLEGIVDPEEAYEDRAIMIKGHVSSSSQPYVMAMMLEALELRRGMKVLEIGTASGYNAALIAEIVGRDSLVYSIEVEADLARRAGKILQEAGYPGITVIAGDGRKGYPVPAPYDRIIVTAQAKSIYPDLLKQISSRGILLTPFDLYGMMTVIVKLSRQDKQRYRGSLVGFPVSFVPIRGVDLTPESEVEEELYDDFYRLMQHLTRAGMELNHQQMTGLVLLLMHYYQQGKLEHTGDYDELIELWKVADQPGLEDFDFEYDLKKDRWQLIPVF